MNHFPSSLTVTTKDQFLRHHLPIMNSIPEGTAFNLSPIKIPINQNNETFSYNPKKVVNQINHFTDEATVERWLKAPDLTFYNQQLNVAVYLATTGCGISAELLQTDRSPYPQPTYINGVTEFVMPSPEKIAYTNAMNFIGSILRFHVYFTTRKILNQLNITLPDETVLTH